MKRSKGALLADLFIAIAAPGAWLYSVYHSTGGAMLSASGLESLKYFTVLSNLLAGAAAWCRLLFRGRGERRWVRRFSFVAAASVGLTLATVLFFLGPMYGYPFLFKGPSLFLHLLVPLAAMGSFIWWFDGALARREIAWCAVPMLIYGVGYVLNNALRDKAEDPFLHDWYGFLLWGYPAGIGIFLLLLLGTLGIGWGLWRLNRARRKQ